MCLWRELWYTVCGHYTIVLEPCKGAKKAQAKGTKITRGRSWSLTFFGKRYNSTAIVETMPINKMTKITYRGDELVLTPTCDYTTPERVELAADLCPECIHTFELCKIEHIHAQQYVRDWRNTNNFGLEGGPLTLVEANGGLTIKKNPVDNYDRGSNGKFYTHRASKSSKQDRLDHERVSEETVARRTRRHDQEEEEQAEKHARSVARYEKKLIFKMHDHETRKNTIANTGVRVEQVLHPHRNSEVFRADPERDAADGQAYTMIPRGDCCPETFVNLELEHEAEDPIQQERYLQDEAARQIKKMAFEGDYNSAAKDAESYKKARTVAVEAKFKEKLKLKHIGEEALRMQKQRAGHQEAISFANVDPRGRCVTNCSVSNSTFGVNVIGRRPAVPNPQQFQSQWPQNRQGPRNVGFEERNRCQPDARRPPGPAPPQSQLERSGQCRPVPNRIESSEVHGRERRSIDPSVQCPNFQPLRANHILQRPVPTPVRNNTVFPGAKDFPSAVKSSSKLYCKFKHTAIDACGDAYGPGLYDSNSSGEWVEKGPEGIQLQELAAKTSGRQDSQCHAQNYEHPTGRTDLNRNFSFSCYDPEVIRQPPPAVRLPRVSAQAQAQSSDIPCFHTSPEVSASSRSIFERAGQASFARSQHPAWVVDYAAADCDGEAHSTSFGSYGSQNPIMASLRQTAVEDDSQIFVVGEDDENEPEGHLFHQPEYIGPRIYGNSVGDDSCDSSTPTYPESSFARPHYSLGLDIYRVGVNYDSLAAHGHSKNYNTSRLNWNREPSQSPINKEFPMSPQGKDNGRGKLPYKVV